MVGLEEDLWGDVVGRAAHGVHRLVLVLQRLREPEVNHLNAFKVIWLREHEVLRLDITMRNALAVEVLEGLEKLFHDIRRLVLAQKLVVDDILEQFAAFAVLEDEEADLVPLPNFEKFDDVRVVQFLQDGYLVNKSLKIFNRFLLDGFDREFLL